MLYYLIYLQLYLIKRLSWRVFYLICFKLCWAAHFNFYLVSPSSFIWSHLGFSEIYFFSRTSRTRTCWCPMLTCWILDLTSENICLRIFIVWAIIPAFGDVFGVCLSLAAGLDRRSFSKKAHWNGKPCQTNSRLITTFLTRSFSHALRWRTQLFERPNGKRKSFLAPCWLIQRQLSHTIYRQDK